MKHASSKLFIVFFLILGSNNLSFAMGAKKNSKPPSSEKGTPVPASPPSSNEYGLYVHQVIDLANNSACKNYAFKNRGTAPAGYIKGVALSFARSLCRMNALNPKSDLALILSGPNSNNDKTDAITHYQSQFSSLGIKNNVAGLEPLISLYTLGIGLGMRESSGKYCEGWDVSAGKNRPSSAAEAGVFQTSYDSISASSELPKLYSEYQNSKPGRCYLDIFKEGASCKSSTTLGTGAGADYQVFNKACPSFATEYAMTMLRIRRNHYGPINRLEAEIPAVCTKMLISVADLINRDVQNACQDLF